MGNGSPDVFASISSFTGGQDVLIGVGALLGASMFVSTVVVGSVTIISPSRVQVDPVIFIRDICFYIFAISVVAYISITGTVTLGVAACYLVLYTVYVLVVIAGWRLDSQQGQTNGDDACNGGVQTAFWHAPTLTGRPSQTYESLLTSDEDHADNADGETPYSFLILGDPAYSRGANYTEEDEDSTMSENDPDVTINLSGGLITPQFDHEIVEDYFERKAPLPHPPPATSPGQLAPFDGVEYGDTDEDSRMPSSFSGGLTQIKQSLLGGGLGATPSLNGSLSRPLLEESPVVAAKRVAARRRQNMFLNSLYWQQWQMRRHMHKRFLSAEWWNFPLHMKAFAMLETPLNIVRDITVPTLDEDLWYKPYSVLQPLCAPLLLIFTLGLWSSSVGVLPVPMIGALAGLPLAMAVCITTHHSHPPTGSVYSILWVLMAFMMCITWIYLFAGELVACLQAIGTISGIPPGVLGLTILAWGNSVGDLFANMAVAKQGLGEMAIAGSYGGPVFNLCLGLGISLLYVSTSSYPEPFYLKLDMSSIVSLVFIYVSAITTILVTIIYKFEMTKNLGYALIGMYFVYTVVQLCILIFG